MFGKKAEPTVLGRAVIAPGGTHLRGSDGEGTDLSRANWSATATIHLKALSAADGQPVDERLTSVRCAIPNWMVYLLHDAGTNEPGADRLPAQVLVDVGISLATRQPVTIDVERVKVEYAAYREAAVDRWKMMAAPLSGVRQLMSAPKRLRDGFKDLTSTWSDAAAGMATPSPGSGPRQAVKDHEVEQIRRSATALAFHYERHRDQWQAARNSALMALPMQAQQVLAGHLHPVDFEVAVMRSHVSKTISDDEAVAFRHQAGLA
jgi:hypothetical protein